MRCICCWYLLLCVCADFATTTSSRAQRFSAHLADVNFEDFLHQQQHTQRSLKPIRGTCQEVEKSYFRLTSMPDPATVRPVSVLKVCVLLGFR